MKSATTNSNMNRSSIFDASMRRKVNDRSMTSNSNLNKVLKFESPYKIYSGLDLLLKQPPKYRELELLKKDLNPNHYVIAVPYLFGINAIALYKRGADAYEPENTSLCSFNLQSLFIGDSKGTKATIRSKKVALASGLPESLRDPWYVQRSAKHDVFDYSIANIAIKGVLTIENNRVQEFLDSIKVAFPNEQLKTDKLSMLVVNKLAEKLTNPNSTKEVIDKVYSVLSHMTFVGEEPFVYDMPSRKVAPYNMTRYYSSPHISGFVTRCVNPFSVTDRDSMPISPDLLTVQRMLSMYKTTKKYNMYPTIGIKVLVNDPKDDPIPKSFAYLLETIKNGTTSELTKLE